MTYCGLGGEVQTNATGGCINDATLTPSEADNIVFDVLLTVAVAFGTFSALIGMGIAFNLLTGKTWNGKKR